MLGFRQVRGADGQLITLVSVAARMIIVSFWTTNVHQEWVELKIVLFSVPAECYSDSVFRFCTQVCTDEVALTGFGIFKLTRPFIISVVSFVVTLETLFMQGDRHEELTRASHVQT
ncbi:gustatory receptor for sugar taste 64e-like [Thrips palmi]|uniref:Gustatory receptor for sugar taste 64e-like n=1 Tax=Thrips palmi TaxID=161013 RepID=A0A6P9ABM0_THRPL|nr:gustatory receptor for sugar taste 64e-like [Thrips palmi]